MSRLENLKMNAELLICFIDFLRTSLEQFSDWLIQYTFNKSSHASEYLLVIHISDCFIFLCSTHCLLIWDLRLHETPWDSLTAHYVLFPVPAQQQARSSQSALSGPSGRRLLWTSDQSHFYLKFKTFGWTFAGAGYGMLLSSACWQ